MCATMSRRTHVVGPAYLDRVLRVDRPLIAPEHGPPLDKSVDGRTGFAGQPGTRLVLSDPLGHKITVTPPQSWPGPWGEVLLNRPMGESSAPWSREVEGTDWQDDLGGMGAGYAAALEGELVSALGSTDDVVSRAVSALLERAGVVHRPIRVAGQAADWTLLITSGPHGDKLPVGFRGCHAALGELPPESLGACDLRVVASLPNRLAAQALQAPGAGIRMFAPAMRNMLDRDTPVASFAGVIDLICCNRQEWESLEHREEVAWRVAMLAITDGPNGSTLRFTTPIGEPGTQRLDAFPRSHPPQDTNRAGEAYASTLVATLLDHGWDASVTDPALALLAGRRASVAAALVLDRRDFGFPSPAEIDAALLAGKVER